MLWKSIVLVAVWLAVCVFANPSHMVLDDGDTGDGHTGDGHTGDGLTLFGFNEDCQELMNEAIHYQLESVFNYIAMATWFRRQDVDIVGMSLMFNAWSRKKLALSKWMMMYMIKRGGAVKFMDIKKPSVTMWSTPVDALVLTLRREKKFTEKINELAIHSKEHQDFNLLAFLKNIVDAQSEYIFEAATYINKMEKGGPQFGLHAMNTQMVTKYRDFVHCESDAEKYKWNY